MAVATIPAGRGINPPSAHLKGAAQVTFDVLDLLLDFRRKLELSGENNARRVVGRTLFASAAVDFLGLAANRLYLLERDVLVQMRKDVDPRDISSSGKGLLLRPDLTAQQPAAGPLPGGQPGPMRLSV